ncbi:MAG: methionyl-tRNA formyltransferase [bacterium]|nr:methionyl-tRNA formyltransferase [bacterium]
MIHNSFIFFGTDEFSVTVLEELRKAGLMPSLIVTVPDRPKGRGLVLTPPPTKEWAKAHSIPLLQPEKLDSTVHRKLETTECGLFVVASYGLILPENILAIPQHGTLNVHPSLLPKYRGATPIESQILNDEKEVGVSIMLMDEEMDHGPIVSVKRWENTKHSTQNPKASELQKILAEEGGKLLAEVLPQWVAGVLEAKPQEHAQATYTKKLTKADGHLNLLDDPYKNFLKIRAFEGSIGTYFFMEKEGKEIRVIIKSAEFQDLPAQAGGKLVITRVVPEGKKEMSYEEFVRGFR